MATPQKRFDTSGKSGARRHHREICKTITFVKAHMALPIGSRAE
jgi:hypothetical protein